MCGCRDSVVRNEIESVSRKILIVKLLSRIRITIYVRLRNVDRKKKRRRRSNGNSGITSMEF